MRGASSQGAGPARRPTLPAILNEASDRLAELGRLGRGDGAEAVALSRLLDVGLDAVAAATLIRIGTTDPPRFAWPDQPAPFPDERPAAA